MDDFCHPLLLPTVAAFLLISTVALSCLWKVLERKTAAKRLLSMWLYVCRETGHFFFTSAGCVNSCTVETLVEASRFYHRPKQAEKERESKPA